MMYHPLLGSLHYLRCLNDYLTDFNINPDIGYVITTHVFVDTTTAP